MRCAWALWLGVALGCAEPAVQTCPDGTTCPSDRECVPGGCVDPAARRACDGRDPNAACDLPDVGPGLCLDGLCVVPICGDGAVEGREVCDDGNLASGDGCRGDCRSNETCGNGEVDVARGEQCDDGNTVAGDGCQATCGLPRCGDGVTDRAPTTPQPETCDDGGNAGGDGCSALCRLEACGNGVLDVGEQCDDGNVDSGDGCQDDCRTPRCGDGVVDAGEQCDDANEGDDDACRNDCAAPQCGDQVVQAGEACDEGAANGDDRACTSSCARARCGDGLVEVGVEACDQGDGNLETGACTPTCARAACGDGLVWQGVEACDDGNQASGDGCRSDCGKVEACGDGVLDVPEACDDGPVGAANPADGCDACALTTWSASSLLQGEVGALDLALYDPRGLAVSREGDLYICDTGANRVRRVDGASGAITTVVGTGEPGFSGDGGPASAARIDRPYAVAVDGRGGLYVADTENHRVRFVDPVTGIIRTIAGTGFEGTAGEGGPAAAAQLSSPQGILVDGFGDVYVSASGTDRIVRIDAATRRLTTIAGSVEGDAGDGGPALAARLDGPRGLALRDGRSLYFADTNNRRIRVIDLATDRIDAVAGTGTAGAAGDGGPALAAQLGSPREVAIAADGALLIADADAHRVRRVDPDGTISTWFGDGVGESDGDGGPASAASADSPRGVAVAPNGDVFVAETSADRVRRIVWATSIVGPYAGDGSTGFASEGGLATSAVTQLPRAVTIGPDGGVYLADSLDRIRRVDPASRIITTIVGDGVAGDQGDGGLATEARIASPRAMVFLPDGDLVFTDTDNRRIRRVDAQTGIVDAYAGTGVDADGGDGGPALGATMRSPRGLAVDEAGNVYVADSSAHRIRRIELATGLITTIGGTGIAGSSGDNGAATAARVRSPYGLGLAAGKLYVADTGNHRIRRIDLSSGIITTIAGTGVAGNGADGLLATATALSSPRGVEGTADGALLIADSGNARIRRVDLGSGLATTVAGDGIPGDLGDGGPATLGRLFEPYRAAALADGSIIIADRSNNRVRRVDGATGLLSTFVGDVDPEGMGPTAQARLASARALALAPNALFVAGGTSGTVQQLGLTSGRLEAVIGRYPQSVATGQTARFRTSAFGDVGGVAVSADGARVYLTEQTAHRVLVVDVVDPADAGTWTLATLAGDPTGSGSAGFIDGVGSAARFRAPAGLFLDETSGDLLVADTGNHVIRTIDLATGTVRTVAGTPAVLGYFGDGGPAEAALLFAPTAVTRCAASEDLFIADTGNQRVRRVAAGSGVVTTVLGDGVASSSGEGQPASAFPVDTPLGVACDALGNLFVTSRTTVRLLPADSIGQVDGSGPVQTVFGAAPRTTYPARAAACLTGVAVVDGETVWLSDECAGLLVELWRQPLP